MTDNPITEKKKEVAKEMYLEGHTIKQIQKIIGTSRRTVYHYINPLSIEDKVLHTENRLKMKEAKKK